MSEEFDGWENIDWGIELDTLEFVLMAIKSHNNQSNVAKRTECLKICQESCYYH